MHRVDFDIKEVDNNEGDLATILAQSLQSRFASVVNAERLGMCFEQ
jgi:hypothetical protein